MTLVAPASKPYKVLNMESEEGLRELYTMYRGKGRTPPRWLTEEMKAWGLDDYTPSDEGMHKSDRQD